MAIADVVNDVLSPIDLLKRKLAGMLQNGKTAQPPQQGQQLTPQAPPTGVDQNSGYQREPDSGLLKRGASTQQSAQPPSYMQTDVTDPNKPAAPTVNQTTPQGAPKQPPTGAPPAAKPYQTDEQWAAANPGAVPALTPTPPKLSFGEKLKKSLAYGMPYWDAREQQTQEAVKEQRNLPQTIHEARMKDEAARAAVGKTEAETANQNAEAQARLNPPQKLPPATPIEQVEEDYRKQAQAGDTAQADKSLDMLTRLQTALHPELADAKDAFQLLMKQHPQYTFDQAMAAINAAKPEPAAATKMEVMEMQDAAGKRFTGRVDEKGNFYSLQNGPDGKPIPAPAGSKKFEQPEFGDVYTATRGAEAMVKPTTDYSTFISQLGASKENLKNAGDGSQLANSIAPLQTALLIVGAGGVHRINMTEINRSGDPAMGSLARQIDAQLEKAANGKIPEATRNEMAQLLDMYSKYKYRSYLQSAYANATYFKMQGDVPVMQEDGNGFIPMSQAMQQAGITEAPKAGAKPAAAAAAPVEKPAAKNDPLGIR
jgi:hypothetical protein